MSRRAPPEADATCRVDVLSRIVDVPTTLGVPAVVRAPLLLGGRADGVGDAYPDALVAAPVVVTDDQEAGRSVSEGLEQRMTVGGILPAIRKHAELLPPVSVRRALGHLRRHTVGVGVEAGRADVALLDVTEEVLTCAPAVSRPSGMIFVYSLVCVLFAA